MTEITLTDEPAASDKDRQWGPEYDWEKPSRAVIACRDGYGVVLWWVGAHMTYEIKEGYGSDLSDLGLDNAPEGISVWEGIYVYSRSGYWDEPDACDVDPSGSFREPTDEEWEAIRRGECPWDKADWLDPDYGEPIETRPMKPEDITEAADALLNDDPKERAARNQEVSAAVASRILADAQED